MRQLDRVGLGWRNEIAPSILAHLDQIDVLEVIADDYFKASPQKISALKTLSQQIPLLYHGVGLGLASSLPVEQKQLDRLSRLFNLVTPTSWSEHLSFVRAGGHEIGHLAAPPRNQATVDGAFENLERIRKSIGSLPLVENIATLLDPPGSSMKESEWTFQILQASGASLLLDLHNLYSNAVNFGYDPIQFLLSFPLHQVQIVHLSGGHWIPEPKGFESSPSGRRLLDDHIHDVPATVFEMLQVLAKTASQPLTVLIERDGHYPDYSVLLDQVQQARLALAKGRQAQKGLRHECAVL
jgi:uncharacterized protein